MVAANKKSDTFFVSCRYCGVEYTLFLDLQDLKEWQAGEGYIQDKLNYLSPIDRELLISGTCDKCWKKMFGDNIEDEEDEEDEDE